MTILITGGDPIPSPLYECDCWGDEPWLWGPVCGFFEDDDTGFCMNCGHHWECHDDELL